MTGRILFVDDDEMVREAQTLSLSEFGYAVETAEDGVSALKLLEQDRDFDLVITDLKMPRMDGIEFVKALKERAGGPPTILLTAHGSIGAAVEAMRFGAADFIEKPVTRDVLKLTVERVLKSTQLARENAALKERVKELQERPGEQLFADSPNMRKVLASIDQIASSDAAVLLTGESGTGKELAARRIHAKSDRRDEPFLSLTCSALPPQLLESELFGANMASNRRGRFLEANGGTLFLDEISDLDLDLQARLLKVLRERSVETPDGEVIPIDVRVIAATHQDLSTLVKEGMFREDLFFYLHVLPLHLPPLRHRKEDISTLFTHFVNRTAERSKKAPPKIAPSLIEALQERPWPGNVRELENVAIRLVLTSPAGTTLSEELLMREDGMGAIAASDEEQRTFYETRVDLAKGALHLPPEGVSLEALERAAVVAALSASGANRSQAARFLRIPRHVLLYRLEKYDIKDEEVLACGGRPMAPLKDLPEGEYE